MPATETGSTPSFGRDMFELTKPRITLFVVMTAYVGFVVGAKVPVFGLDFSTLLHTLLGTALVASGTSVFNQLWEIKLDARMKRTASRPLPAGRISPATAFGFGAALSILGIAELAVFANAITSVLAATTLLSYVFVYTPMKTRSPLSTIVGAIPGALPPLGGFTASSGAIAPEGLVLFAILFLWQLPHFFAIGWKHRKDYGEAGCQILAVIDPSGKSSGRQALWYTALLLPVSMAPAFLGTTGVLYGVAALLLTSLFLLSSLQFARETTDRNATRLFLMSIGWLPAVLILLLANRLTGV
ncbi:MAG: protoheme IX farnesyltransferase [Acidobacteria bacterium]|nr:protoheme IX farnesyltransferase [Acidobacteriota bacterium]